MRDHGFERERGSGKTVVFSVEESSELANAENRVVLREELATT